MRRALLLGLLPIVATVASCLGPTEIMVHLTTNACSTPTPVSRVDLYLGAASAPATSAGGCVDASTVDLGTIAVLPSGAIDERVEIGIVGDIGASGACSTLASTADPQCIVAKRSLSFVPHTRLDLPVFLDVACAGFQCPDGQTCVADQAGPHCEGQTCDVDGGVQCSVDAGAPDASVLDVASDSHLLDAVTDISLFDVTGPPVCPDLLPNTTHLFTWSFNPQSNALINEDSGKVTPQAPLSGVTLTTTLPTYCGSYLAAKAVQTIAPADKSFNLSSFSIAFAYRAAITNTSGTIVQLGTNLNGFQITLSNSALTVVFNQSVSFPVYTDALPTNDGLWHTFVMHVTTSAADGGTATTKISCTRDLIGPTTKTTQYPYQPTNGPLTVGPIDGVDQIEITTP